jgi:hypothetical protein
MFTAVEYRAVKVIAIGAVDSAREVIQYDSDMRNRVAEIAVPLMTEQETCQILDKGEGLLNVRFGHLKKELPAYSSGLPAVCHQLSLNICFAAGIIETCSEATSIEQDHFRRALNRYVEDASGGSSGKDPVAGASNGSEAFDFPKRPVRMRVHGLPRFVVTRGGEYCFLPGLRALRWPAELKT